MKWSVTPTYKKADHEPAVKIEGPLAIMASAGEKMRLSDAVSDPDGDTVAVKWITAPGH